MPRRTFTPANHKPRSKYARRRYKRRKQEVYANRPKKRDRRSKRRDSVSPEEFDKLIRAFDAKDPGE